MVEREIDYEKYALSLATFGLLAIATMGAFSRKSKEEIWKRDGGVSALSGQNGRLEASHISHAKDERYDDPSNGRLLTTREHYIDHYNRHGRNGLTMAGNKWALRKIWERLTGQDKNGLPPPESIE